MLFNKYVLPLLLTPVMILIGSLSIILSIWFKYSSRLIIFSPPIELFVQNPSIFWFLYYNRISTKVVVTKTDTLSKAQVSNQLQIICSKLAITKNDIILTSSQDKQGHKELLDSIEGFVYNN